MESPREIPTYSISEFAPRRTKYCVCVFVINEGERIRAQLGRMIAFAEHADIIIADGGSTDGSLYAPHLKSHNVRALLTKRDAGGLSAQMRMAFDYALNQGYEGVITIDGNNKDDPSAILRFAAALDAGIDHAQGSRFIKGGQHKNTPLMRLIGVRVVHAPLISIAAGHRYTDTTNGFRAYSAHFLRDPHVSPFRAIFSDYELHYYLAIRAARLGFKVKEVPVARIYPGRGPTPTKIHSFAGNWKIFTTLLKASCGKFAPD